MKKLFLILGILVSFAAVGAAAEKSADKDNIGKFISECRNYEGTEVVHLGSFATSAVKGFLKITSIDDPDAREAMKLMKGVRSLYVFRYEDCSKSNKSRIDKRLAELLKGSEMLMEASDGDEKVRMYGVIEGNGKTLKDFILHVPSDNAVICIMGSISTEVLTKMALND